MADHLPLAADFPPANEAQWRKLVDAVLKGADFDRNLVSRTYDGLIVRPLYPCRTDAQPWAGRTPGAPWQVLARIDHPDPAAANAQALEELENGAAGLALVFAGSVGAYGYGLDGSEAAIARILRDVHPGAGITIECQLSSQTRDAPLHIAKWLRALGVDTAQTEIRAGFDPLGLMAQRGGSPMSWSELASLFAARVRDLIAQGWRAPLAVADARPVHAAGGSEAQELAFALANAAAYLRALEAAGLPLGDARRMIAFRLAADDDQFLTIAKFRALRKLWARVEDACGLAPEPVFISAETAWRMMTRRDAYVNMLRTTIAAFSAGLGGANAISILPFTNALGLPNAHARRIARNLQLILLEESNLAKVADPAAGSGGIEDLTDQLCRAAWLLFQEIEAAGGAAAALEANLIQRKVAQVGAAREKNIATRRDALTGTSEFPHLAETPPAVLQAESVMVAAMPSVVRFDALTPSRLAEPFEQLRDAAERMLEKTGARPKVFLATLGKPSDFVERATFAKNFFEAGGIEAISNDEPANDATATSLAVRPTEKDAGLVATFKASGAELACLCSSDEVYVREAAAAARGLAAAGARQVYLAGRPKDASALQHAGVGTFIYSGCDALATLRAAHDILKL